MRLLVSFCNFSAPQPTGLLELGAEQNGPRWVPVHDDTRSIRSATGLTHTPSRLYAVWLDEQQRCFVSVLELPSLGVISVDRLAGVRDAHSACISDGSLCVVSTGTDELWRFPIAGDSVGAGEVIWRASDRGEDTHHVNSVAEVGGRLCCTAFGPKRGALWSTAVDGYVVDVERGDVLSSALEHPHSLHCEGDDVYVAESRRARVHCLTSATTHDVGGYARGLCVLPETIVTATSSARVRSKSTGVVENPADPGDPFGQAGLSVIAKAPHAAGRPRWIDLSTFGQEIYDIACLRG